MKIYNTYKVAGVVFGLTLPEYLAVPEVLHQYDPFLCEDGSQPSFSVEVCADSRLDDRIASFSYRRFNEEAPYMWLVTSGQELVSAGFSNSPDKPASVYDSSSSILYVDEAAAPREVSFHINNVLMLAYADFGGMRGRLMVHASVVVREGKGYIFLGRSGTGKSTHTRLWLRHIEGSRLLNDDNPVVYVEEGQVKVSGSPWSGKTPCYINEEYPLQGIVRLSQAPHNEISPVKGIRAYASFLPSCSCMKWNKAQSDMVSDTVMQVINNVQVWHLECLPDEDAALVCSGKIQ